MECVCWWNCHHIINNVCSALHLPWMRCKNQDTSRSRKMRSWSFCCSFPLTFVVTGIWQPKDKEKWDKKVFLSKSQNCVGTAIRTLIFLLKTIVITISNTFVICSHNKFPQMSEVAAPFEEYKALSLFLPHLSLEIWDKAACVQYRALTEHALCACPR